MRDTAAVLRDAAGAIDAGLSVPSGMAIARPPGSDDMRDRHLTVIDESARARDMWPVRQDMPPDRWGGCATRRDASPGAGDGTVALPDISAARRDGTVRAATCLALLPPSVGDVPPTTTSSEYVAPRSRDTPAVATDTSVVRLPTSPVARNTPDAAAVVPMDHAPRTF